MRVGDHVSISLKPLFAVRRNANIHLAVIVFVGVFDIIRKSFDLQTLRSASDSRCRPGGSRDEATRAERHDTGHAKSVPLRCVDVGGTDKCRLTMTAFVVSTTGS